MSKPRSCRCFLRADEPTIWVVDLRVVLRSVLVVLRGLLGVGCGVRVGLGVAVGRRRKKHEGEEEGRRTKEKKNKEEEENKIDLIRGERKRNREEVMLP